MFKKILVIDDEHQIRAVVCKFLNKVGFLAMRAKNGWQGLRMASRFLPDLILLDIKMPLIDGFAVLHRLKKSEKTMHIPIIMLTGINDDNTKLKAAGLYSEQYITKPFDLDELYVEITKILGVPSYSKH